MKTKKHKLVKSKLVGGWAYESSKKLDGKSVIIKSSSSNTSSSNNSSSNSKSKSKSRHKRKQKKVKAKGIKTKKY